MNTNRILLAGIAGGIIFFLFGFLLYGLLLSKFFVANAGTAQGVMREPPIWWALIAGNLIWGILLAIIFGRWAGIKTLETGAKAGAVIGGLAALSVDLNMYATMNLSNLTGLVADVLVMTVISAATGAVVGWMLGRGNVG